MKSWKLGLQRHALRTLMPLLRNLPTPASTRLLEAMAWFNYKVVPGNYQIYQERMIHGADRLAEDWDIDAVARRYSSGLVHWRTRDRLLDGLDDDAAVGRFVVEGRDHLDDAYARKRGVILLGNHFGTHLHPTHWLFRERYPIRLFMERPRNLSKYLSKSFETDGPLGQEKLFISRRFTPTEAAGSILRAMRVLNSGMVLQIASDVRWDGGHTALGNFLGSTYRFSTTWVVLAAMTGASVVPVFSRPIADGRYLLEYLPAYLVPREFAKNGRAGQYVQRSLDCITEQVRRHPDQSNDYFDWTGEVDLSLAKVA